MALTFRKAMLTTTVSSSTRSSMERCVIYNGETRKVFPIVAFGNKYDVIVVPSQYQTDETLALQVLDIVYDEEHNELTYFEPFGMLTVNMSSGLQSNTQAFVKSYSENEEWADKLAEAIGGKKTNISKQAGYASVSLWDFSNINV